MMISIEEIWSTISEQSTPTGAFRLFDDSHPLDLFAGIDPEGRRVLMLITDEAPKDLPLPGVIEVTLAQCRGNALNRLNAVLQAGFDVNMKMGGPEQLAAMVALMRPDNAHLYGRIVAVEEVLFRPLLTRLISDGVADGIFDTFDPEGVADMIYGLAARTNTNILNVSRAADKSARDQAIDVLTTRFQLHGLAIDRILGLLDGSITTLTRAQVEAMVAALPRSY